MIRDLENQKLLEVTTDIVIIGGGIAGLIAATELASHGKRVIVVESGKETRSDQVEALNEVEQTGQTYAGAQLGRARCLGGTSLLWGGAMLPFLRTDFERDDGPWPIEYSEIAPYFKEIEHLFALPDHPYECPEVLKNRENKDFIPRIAKWPNFQTRNVVNALKRKIKSNTNLDIWLNSTVTDFNFAESGKIQSVLARNINGGNIKVSADEFVCAAGAIETTRILLTIDRKKNEKIFGKHKIIGRYFHDHLSSSVAKISPSSSVLFNRTFGFRFTGSTMQNLRFESAIKSRLSFPTAAGFAHVGFSEVNGGFSGLRDIYRGIQQNTFPNATMIAKVMKDTPWLIRAAWWRFIEKRLLPPSGSDFMLHGVIEQKPIQSNRITLGNSVDALGQLRSRIHWEVTDQDRQNFTQFVDRFEQFWEQSKLQDLGMFERRAQGEAETELCYGGGIYHPCGSTKIGLSVNEGVVDRNLTCFGVQNLSVLATSVFPRAGGANPTMTLMALSVRLARRLALT